MVVFIPIKEKSQRTPNKNFREFRGLPLYQFTILNLLEHDFIRKIFIDTDSEEIIKWSKNFNKIFAYNRNDNLKGHNISVCDLIENFIIKENINEWILQTHITSPLINYETWKNLYLKFISDNYYDSYIGCNEIQSRLWIKRNNKHYPLNHNPMILEQTQDLDIIYEENSTFYLFHSNTFLQNNNRIGLNPFFYPLKFPENIDIDTEDDWNLLKNHLE